MDGKDQKAAAQNKLLIVTGLLSFFYYAEAKIQGISLVGATIQFNNEAAILHFGWVIWLYYYLRTYQYFVEDGAKSYRKVLDAVFMDELGHRLAGISQHDFRLIPNDDGLKSSVIRIKLFGGPGPRPPSFLSWLAAKVATKISHMFGLTYPRHQSGLLMINFLRLQGQRQLLKFLYAPSWFNPHAVIYPPSNRHSLQGQERQYVQIRGHIISRLAIIYFKAMTMRPAFTENYGPLIIGLVPVYYLIYLNRNAMAWLLAF
ncbi:hypothetical protein SAMN05518669_11324 [Variovorax sp. YR634]|uniref:hypothetical protein n=1 Tax=Variovorax sp. YR634 TaxID=1884385 RepID=UPI0008970B3D|nr:hypothetical protein [Variovorax sp. YR634]SDY52859.1 hypothetical protein SAMN05518669_11324 [Variovorax sp. YR634]